MTDYAKNNYWSHTGRFQHMIDLLNDMVPVEGRVANPGKNKALERFRIASNCYYDLFNNGGGNRHQQIFKLFGPGTTRRINDKFTPIEVVFARTEPVMDAIILAALEEQGLSEQLELFAV